MTLAPRRPFATSLLTTILLALAVGSVSPALAARFLHFQALTRPQGVELVADGKLILRVRPGMQINGGVARLAEELNRLAFQGLRPADLSVRTETAGCEIVAKGVTLVTVDKATALLGGSTPEGLVGGWVASLKAVLASPYVVLDQRTKLPVPMGETRSVRWGGTATVQLSFSVADPAVASVQLDDKRAVLMVRGLTTGTTAITASVPGDNVSVAVEVKAWAARLTAPAVAEVTSPPLPADDLRRTLRNAVLSAVQPAADAAIALGEPRPNGARYDVPLQARGPSCFDVDLTVPVDVKVVSTPRPAVDQLLVSNSPEKITEPATLLRERFLGKAPLRLLWHHVNKGQRPLRFVVRIANLGDTPARVHVTEAATGPHDDEIFVGHQAMMRFLALDQQGEGYLLNIPAGRMLDLYDVRLPVEGIVSGLARLTPVEGTGLMLEVVAEDAWPTDAYFAAVPPRLKADPPLTPYRYEAAKEVALQHESGGAWAFYGIGRDFSTNLQGQRLYGDYGVLYTIAITCKNPQPQPARVLLTLHAGGGVARASYFLAGKLTETGLLRPGAEEIIAQLELAPNEQRVVKLIMMPESGSNYPITLTVRGPQARE